MKTSSYVTNSGLHVENLSVSVDGRNLIDNISFSVPAGTCVALMGPNGSGKSSLCLALMGHLRYTITKGRVAYANTDIIHMSSDKRAQRGLFLAFQNPPDIPGVSVQHFLKEAYRALHGMSSDEFFVERMARFSSLLQLDDHFLSRSMEGFSGGQKKLIEALSMFVLHPRCIMIDELDSGLDPDALSRVARGLSLLREEFPETSFFVITHHQKIFEHLSPEVVFILQHGSLIARGGSDLLQTIASTGYHAIVS